MVVVQPRVQRVGNQRSANERTGSITPVNTIWGHQSAEQAHTRDKGPPGIGPSGSKALASAASFGSASFCRINHAGHALRVSTLDGSKHCAVFAARAEQLHQTTANPKKAARRKNAGAAAPAVPHAAADR